MKDIWIDRYRYNLKEYKYTQYKDRQIERYIEKQIDRQLERWIDRKIDRQAQRWKDRKNQMMTRKFCDSLICSITHRLVNKGTVGIHTIYI